MKTKDILALCAGNLFRRKTRTILAVIGVIVGVCAIVVMVSIGVALDVGYKDQIASYGNLHNIEVYYYGGGGGSPSGKKPEVLNDNTIAKMSKIEGVTAISPKIEEYLTIGVGKMKTQAGIIGLDPEYVAKMNYDLEKGRNMTPADSESNVLMFGYNVACWFFNPRQSQGYDWSNTEPTVDVVSRDVILTGDWNWGTNNSSGDDSVHYEEFEAEGIALMSGQDSEQSYSVLMPIKALQKIVDANRKAEGGQVSNGQKSYEQAVIYVEDIDLVSTICKTIKEDYGFQTYSLNDILEEFQKTAQMIEMVLGGIGAVSLLVAAIGIANTMIMSVYERTREIGVMKVIGASLGDIQKMFLVEAGLIGFGGGVIGIGLSYLISFIINKVGVGLMEGLMGSGVSRASVIPWWLSLGALLFATFVGIISGWLPAKRAMNLSALEGLKNE